MAAVGVTDDVDDSITCSVCLEPFKSPKVLTCGHSFCLEPCLRDVMASRKNRSKNIHCPLCRNKVHLPKSGNVSDFPTNFSLQGILERRNRLERESAVHLCQHLDAAEFYCESCRQFLCPDCAFNYHSDSQHSIVARDTGMECARRQGEQMVHDAITLLEQKVKRQHELLSEAEIMRVSYTLQCEELSMGVRRNAGRMREAIDVMEQNALTDISTQAETERNTFHQFVTNLKTLKTADEQQIGTLRNIQSQVQAGNLSSMNEVLGIGQIDATCTSMVEEMRTKLTTAPPFTLYSIPPNAMPKLLRRKFESPSQI